MSQSGSCPHVSGWKSKIFETTTQGVHIFDLPSLCYSIVFMDVVAWVAEIWFNITSHLSPTPTHKPPFGPLGGQNPCTGPKNVANVRPHQVVQQNGWTNSERISVVLFGNLWGENIKNVHVTVSWLSSETTQNMTEGLPVINKKEQSIKSQNNNDNN